MRAFISNKIGITTRLMLVALLITNSILLIKPLHVLAATYGDYTYTVSDNGAVVSKCMRK